MKYVDEFELNKAVAAIEGYTVAGPLGPRGAPVIALDASGEKVIRDFCNNWGEAGPLVEKYGICLAKLKNGKWLACGDQQGITSRTFRQESMKPLVSAMLCVVDLVERKNRRGGYDA